jgi:hypothetical protein
MTHSAKQLAQSGARREAGSDLIAFAQEVQNPTHGSGWILQALPTMPAISRVGESLQRKLGDAFKSNLR